MEQVLNSVEREEDFLIAANSEIGQLCAQNVLLWRQLLERFAGCEPVRVLLAQQHHTYRVRRFAEAFYVIDHPRHAMANCNDADVHTYLYISESLRKSRYSTLPHSLLHLAHLQQFIASNEIQVEFSSPKRTGLPFQSNWIVSN